MVLNMGAFYEGKNENDQRRRAQRKENAALYSDFIRMNPDSSVGDREGFVKSLGGSDSKFVRATLPTRNVMEANVARRKREVGAAAKSRKLKLLQQQMSFMNDATDMYANTYLSTGDPKAASAGLSMFDEILTPEMRSAVAAQGEQVAVTKFDQKMQPFWDAWKESGATAKGMESWAAQAPTEAFVQKWYNRGNAYMGQLGQREYITAQEQMQAVATSNDPARQDQYRDSLRDKYPHLSDDQYQSLITGVDTGSAQAAQKANDVIESKASTIVSQIIRKAQQPINGSDGGGADILGLQDVGAITEAIQAEFDKDPSITRAPTNQEIEEIEKVVSEMQQGIVKQLDKAEQTAAKDLLYQSENEGVRYNPMFVDSQDNPDLAELRKQEDAALSSLDQYAPVLSGTGKSDVNKAALDNMRSKFAASFNERVRYYGINISDPSVYLALLEGTARGHAEDGMIEFDDKWFLQTVHERLGKDNATNEGIAYNLTLREMGISSIADFVADDVYGNNDAAKFNAAFAANRVARIEALTDLYDAERTNLTQVDSQLRSTVATTNSTTSGLSNGEVISSVEDIVAGGVIQNTGQIDGLREQQDRIQSIVINNAMKLDKIDQEILSAEAYLKIPQFANDPDLQGERATVVAAIKELKTSRASLVEQIDLYDEAAEKLDIPVNLAVADVGTKTREGQQFAAEVIAYQINSFGLDPSKVEAAAREMAESAWAEIDTTFFTFGDTDLRDENTEMRKRDKWIDQVVQMVTGTN